MALLGPVALFLAIAPIQPEPHLWEKLKMLLAGTLTRPIDIFDLLMHSSLLIVLLLKIFWRTKPGVVAGKQSINDR